MTFLDTIQQHQEVKELTLDVFIEDVEKFSCLDEALVKLPDRYLEYFINNKNNIDKLIMKFNINEAEEQGYLGWSNPPKTTKKVIRYKGKTIVLEYDEELSLWTHEISYRNIVKCLNSAKALIDENKE